MTRKRKQILGSAPCLSPVGTRHSGWTISPADLNASAIGDRSCGSARAKPWTFVYAGSLNVRWRRGGGASRCDHRPRPAADRGSCRANEGAASFPRIPEAHNSGRHPGPIWPIFKQNRSIPSPSQQQPAFGSPQDFAFTRCTFSGSWRPERPYVVCPCADSHRLELTMNWQLAPG